jgi:uncharacterized protein YukE
MQINFDEITNEFHRKVLTENLIKTANYFLERQLETFKDSENTVHKFLNAIPESTDEHFDPEFEKQVDAMHRHEKWYLEWKQTLATLQAQLPNDDKLSSKATKLAELRKRFEK